MHTRLSAVAVAVTAALVSTSWMALSAQGQTQIQVGGGPAGSPGAPLQAPSTTGEPLQFEVASIKPNKTGGGQVMIGIQPGGRLNALNVTLRDLIRTAYQVQPFQIVGGPSWITTDRFDIQAKAESDFPVGGPPIPGGPPGIPQQMLQALLRDRFTLATHVETREMPTYDLVLARRDGSLGGKLKASSLDCVALAARGRGAAPPPPGPGGVPGCGMRIGPGILSGNGVPMPLLANSLSQMVQRIVTDKTGLSGNYEFEVTFTPDGPLPGPGTLPPGAPPLPPINPDAPSIYTAVQEQLGLKLENTRGAVTVLVIDRVEPPTPD
jgi:uncharacterized protein (TIGR03435 family)